MSWEQRAPEVAGDLALPHLLLPGVSARQDERGQVSKAELRRRKGIPQCDMHLSADLPTIERGSISSRTLSRKNQNSKTRRTKQKDKAAGKEPQALSGAMETALCLRHWSLGCLAPQNPVRRTLYLLVTSRAFEWGSLLVLLLSTVSMALASPGMDGNGGAWRMALWYSDIVFTTLFAVECALKIVVLGFFRHEGSYLQNSWNRLDFLVTATSLASLFVEGHRELRAIRAFRLLRALRPLRMVTRLKNMQMVVVTLLQSLPSIFNVTVFGSFGILAFAVLGIQLFSGKFYSCNDPSVRHRQECVGMYTDPQGGFQAREWLNAKTNFDNLGQALVSLSVFVTMDDWISVMYLGMDAVAVDRQPKLNHNPAASVFFIAFLLLGGIFWANLLAGVVTACYGKLPPEDKDMLFVTETQKRWAEAIKINRYQTQERKKLTPPKNWLRRVVFQLVHYYYFEVAILLAICANILIMAMKHVNQSKGFERLETGSNYFFTYLYLGELLLKLLALGPRMYWREIWNRFDVIIVTGSFIDLYSKLSVGARVFRIFRIARLFKIVEGAQGLRTLFNTFVMSLPAMANVGSLLFILMFIYAIIGMELFGDLPYGEGLSPNNNFRNFGAAMLVCFKIFTGDNWTPIWFQTSCTDSSSCKVYVLAPLYFLSFTIITRCVMLNLVIAVLLDRFVDSATYEGLLSTDNFFDALQRKLLLDGFVKKLKQKVTLFRLQQSRKFAPPQSEEEPDTLMSSVPVGLMTFSLKGKKGGAHSITNMQLRTARVSVESYESDRDSLSGED